MASLTSPSSEKSRSTSHSTQLSHELIEKILLRAQAHAMAMIYIANTRDDVQRGDPKVGGHPSATSSALHLLGLLHLVEKRPEDFMAVKPHASPADHSFNYNLRLFRESDGSIMNDERSRQAMKNLRHFSHTGEPSFQSYHSAYDPDHWNFLPSGSVGIPPVNALYLAEAYKMAHAQKTYGVQDPHFWCLMGDSEFREGSLLEAMPEGRERGLNRLTWIVDYNRQSLDGNRTHSEEALGFKDCDRIEGLASANGWDVIQLRHGAFRKKVFAEKNGDALQEVFEKALPDGELQALLAGKNAKKLVEAVDAYDKAAAKLLSSMKESDVMKFLTDFGGHDIETVLDAYKQARASTDKPTMIVAHTLKGWGLKCAAMPSNHSMLVEEDEVKELLKKSGTKSDDLFAFERFDEKSDEAKYLKKRGEEVYAGIRSVEAAKEKNIKTLETELKTTGWTVETPTEVGVNLKLVPMAHTQWVLGQITAKLNRIGDTPKEGNPEKKQRALTPEELKWKVAGSHFVTMAPDVGTSTNLNASMDGKTFGPEAQDFDEIYGTEDKGAPDITPHQDTFARHLRFEIAESNTMSCVGSFGKMADYTGIPYIPVMTVYDFFIKRALDQLFYNAYWKSHFILVGTPSGVSLSPEGAQHGWKSDIQIANMITWEPAFGLEFDWVFADAMNRHLNSYRGVKEHNAEGRSAVLIRAVTRALEQKVMLQRLRTHKRFEGMDDAAILEATRKDCLEGAWYVVDHRGQDAYKPGDNVVNLFTMGVMVSEALAASDELLKEGIYANVIQVSSPDLLVGNQGYESGYKHLKETLGIQGDLYLGSAKKSAQSYPPLQFGPSPGDQAKLGMLGAARIPVVSVHDGEPGLLDNIGSCVGVLQKALAVRKHSKSGRPSDVYTYHGIDGASVKQACMDALEEIAWRSKVQL
ncbi:MAG: pyruvate dehydrogenase [Bdellovibrionota bacterium]